jgi:hypothetical protein
MSLLNRKTDLQKHLSSHGRKHLHLSDPATQPDATGFSGDGVTIAEPNTSNPVPQSDAGIISTIVPAHVDGPDASAVPPTPKA